MWKLLLDQALGALLREGRLELWLPDGSARHYGSGPEAPVVVRLHDPGLVGRLVRNPALAVGEGYMDGTLTIDGDDLHGLIGLGVRNLAARNGAWWHRLAEKGRNAARVARQWNPAGRARQNVAHHYDLSGELYDLFLDADRQYSCAYFTRPDMTLEQAQAAKKAHIAGKLLLDKDMRVLDIGCGWGGMALTLARDHGARVLGVTLSEEQHRVATERAKAAGLDRRVEFRLADYRSVSGEFDRIVSVGMFEHVGVPHYREYFRTLRERLAPGGVALVHTIGRAAPPGSTNPWISKYISPGGYVPALSEVMAAVEREGLWQTDIEIWRLHYAETLRHWLARFEANLDKAQALYDERFCRMWRFYLVACEQTFRLNRQCVFQLQLARKQDAVPLTRDYLYRPPPALAHAAE